MKILYVCRLYSGFEESIKTGEWNPKGAPTIARMIEHLDKSKEHDLTIILTQKNKNSDLKLKPIQRFNLKGLLTPITIISGPDIIPKWSWKFQDKLSDAHQLLRIFATYLKLKPDIVYCDRVNILPAAFLSRFTKAKVIWRVMGVLQDMHQDATNKNIRSNFRKLLWRSPFKSVICTLDGSGGGVWMNKVLNPVVTRHLLINGINKKQSADAYVKLPDGVIKALFVGRLESLKGIEEFMESFYEAAKQNKKLHAVIAGDGSLKEDIILQSKKLKMQDRVHFLGSITPNQLKYVRQNCSFYVSLNKQGNLSNVNIEALYDELPTIIPTSQSEKNIDIDTDNFIPKNVFYRFGKVGDKQALSDAMIFMSDDNNRNSFKQNMKSCAVKLLPSWQERINQEVEIFEDVNKGHDIAIIIADLGAGGAQKVASSLANEAIENGHGCALITLSNDKNDFFKLDNNIDRIALNEQKSSNSLAQSVISNVVRIYKIRKAIKYLAPQNTISFITPTNILTIIATFGIKTKVIISERNDPARQSFGRVWDWLREKLYGYANIITANSSNAIENLKQYVPSQKLIFVPNALPAPDAKYIVPYDKKEPNILIVGRLHPQKSHKTLIDAFAQITKKYPDWSLVIAGDGALREKLIQQVSSLNIKSKVKFLGTVENPFELYSKASIFILPSIHEGMPNSLLEAMSCGIAPIISDACKGAFTYVTHDETGLIFPVGDINKLSNELDRLISDKNLCSKIGRNAQNKILTLYEKNTYDLWADALSLEGRQ